MTSDEVMAARYKIEEIKCLDIKKDALKKNNAERQSIVFDIRKCLFLLYSCDAARLLGYKKIKDLFRKEFGSTYFYTIELTSAVLEKYVCDIPIGSISSKELRLCGLKSFNILSLDLKHLKDDGVQQAKQVWEGIKSNYHSNSNYRASSLVAMTKIIKDLNEKTKDVRSEKDVENARIESIEGYRDRQADLIPLIEEICGEHPLLQVTCYKVLVREGIPSCKKMLRKIRDGNEY